MKKIFKIDTTLYPLAFMTAATGLGLHISGHGNNHRIWELWASAHTLIAIFFACMVVLHLSTHKPWLKNLRDKTFRKKHRTTMLLAMFALCAAVTGLILLTIKGANTHIGLLHYILGIIFTFLAIGHSVKKFPILRKAFNK